MPRKPYTIDWVADVYAFHQKFGMPIGYLPKDTPDATPLEELMVEEFREMMDALGFDAFYDKDITWLEISRGYYKKDLVRAAHEGVDVIYAIIGYFIALGIDLRPAFAEVHRANMEKEPGEGFKLVKPEGWTPPNIAAVFSAQLPLKALAKEPEES